MGIIFSKDRAMQLDATLRSFLLHCQDSEAIEIYVLYKVTDSVHKQQYARLEGEFASRTKNIYFVEEKNFRRGVMELLVSRSIENHLRIVYRFLTYFKFPLKLSSALTSFVRQSFVLFLVDDNIFVRDFTLNDACASLMSHPEALGFSLRLGKNTTYCYTRNKRQQLPEFGQLSKNILIFDWTKADGNFDYPLEISSSVYRLKDVVYLINQLYFSNPNTLEGQMASHAYLFKMTNPCLLCYDISVTFCNPINKVQTAANNRAGLNPEYTSDFLAKSFDVGSRVKVEYYNNFIPASCHQEVELSFENRENGGPL